MESQIDHTILDSVGGVLVICWCYLDLEPASGASFAVPSAPYLELRSGPKVASTAGQVRSPLNEARAVTRAEF